MTAIIKTLESSVDLFSDFAKKSLEDHAEYEDKKDSAMSLWSLGRSRAYELAATHFKNIVDRYKKSEGWEANKTGRDYAIHNTVAVRVSSSKDQYRLDWTDDDGNNSVIICYVFGFENAIRVARGIAHDQCESVKYPCFESHEVTE